MKFIVVLEPEPGGGYSVVCPAIPGCVSQGQDLAAALANIREAILLCLEVRREDRLVPVLKTPELIAREIQECLEDRAAGGLPPDDRDAGGGCGGRGRSLMPRLPRVSDREAVSVFQRAGFESSKPDPPEP